MTVERSPKSNEISEHHKPGFNAVAIFCAGIKKTHSGWVPTNYQDKDTKGMLGGGIRIAAAVELYCNGVANTFLFSGGGNKKTQIQYPEGTEIPIEASIYRDRFLRIIELKREEAQRRKLQGLEYDKRLDALTPPVVLTEDTSNNTASGAENIIAIAKRHNWQTLLVASSTLHIERASLLVDFYQRASENDADSITIQYASAEEICRFFNKGIYESAIFHFTDTKANPDARLRQLNERQGVADFSGGVYNPNEQV